MEEHYVLPKGPDETKLVEGRILDLSRAVLTPVEWLNLLAAAETVLPRQKGKRVKPSDLNLAALRSRPQMILFAAILYSVGSEETYKTNQRYNLHDWMRITLKFAELSLYVVPPARLDYAVELCMAAMSTKAGMDSILLTYALSEADIRVVRQLVPAQKIDEWSNVLIGRLEDICGRGEDIQVHNDEEEPYDQDDYEEWLADSESILEIANKFCGWSRRSELQEMSRLRRLIGSVEEATRSRRS